MNKLHIGIVGNGSMAGERAREFAKTPAKVTGVHARDLVKARKLAETVGAETFDRYEMLLDAVDAVVICLPNYLHASTAMQALQRGKHVLVEYPLCTSPDELAQLREASQASGRVLMTGNTIVHEAPFQYASTHIDRIGEVLSAASRVDYHAADVAGAWYLNPRLRGPLFSAMHYHHIEYYRRFLGEVRWVMASDQSQTDVSMGGVVMMGHDAGRTSCVQWYLSSIGAGLSRGMWLTGTHGSLSMISQVPGMSHAIWNGGEVKDTELLSDDWGIAGSCGDFLKAIDGKFDHRAALESDALTLRIGWLAGKSAETGQRIAVS